MGEGVRVNITRDQLEAYDRDELIDLVHTIESVINDKTRLEIAEMVKPLKADHTKAEEIYFEAMRSYSNAKHPSLKRSKETELEIARNVFNSLNDTINQIHRSRPMVDFFNSKYIGPIG